MQDVDNASPRVDSMPIEDKCCLISPIVSFVSSSSKAIVVFGLTREYYAINVETNDTAFYLQFFSFSLNSIFLICFRAMNYFSSILATKVFSVFFLPCFFFFFFPPRIDNTSKYAILVVKSSGESSVNSKRIMESRREAFISVRGLSDRFTLAWQ